MIDYSRIASCVELYMKRTKFVPYISEHRGEFPSRDLYILEIASDFDFNYFNGYIDILDDDHVMDYRCICVKMDSDKEYDAFEEARKWCKSHNERYNETGEYMAIDDLYFPHSFQNTNGLYNICSSFLKEINNKNSFCDGRSLMITDEGCSVEDCYSVVPDDYYD